jgi:phospholipid-translocating ATPase
MLTMNRILEMHNKTWLSGLGWFLSVGGWFLWTIFLSAVYKPGKTYPLYPIKDGFLEFFGHDLLWWMVLALTLAAVVLLEIGTSSIRKAFWPTDTDIFQELQKDKFIKRRFEETIRAEQGGGEVEMGREKTSMEARREGEIQELLERPRIMDGEVTNAEVLRSPVEMIGTGVSRSASGSYLTRRKFSTDSYGGRRGITEEFELAPRSTVPPKTRHSVDIAEILGGR